MNIMEAANAVTAAPFVGLRPFDASDARWFFGREREEAALRRKLTRGPFTAVVGPSGSGKSSLVRAGVVPRMRDEGWTPIIAKPGSAPIARLAASLAASVPAGRLADARLSRFDTVLRASAFGLVDIMKMLAGQVPKVLLVVDQFEELFRYGDEATGSLQAAMREEARAFIEQLLAGAFQAGESLHICITLRSDFFGNCTTYAGLAEAISDSQFLVPLPTRGQLEDAIRRPLAAASVEIDEALVQRLLVDVADETDKLPLLQHTLRRLWERAARTPRRLLESDYTDVGGIHGSIDVKARAVLDGLVKANAVDAFTIERVMKALTGLDHHDREARRPQKKSDLLDLLRDTPGIGPGFAAASLDRLIVGMSAETASFIQIGEGNNPEIDIGHEALIRGWKKCCGDKADFQTGWLREDRSDAYRWRSYVLRVTENGTFSNWEWRNFHLWRVRQRIGEVWTQRYGNRWPEVSALLAQSVFTSRKRSAGVAAVGLMALAAFIYPSYKFAQSSIQLADDNALKSKRHYSLQLAAHARLEAKRSDARAGALLARAALPASLSAADRAYVPQAEGALVDAMLRPVEIMRLKGPSIKFGAAAFSPDGKRIVSASDDKTIRLWDAATGQPIGAPLTGPLEGVLSAAFSPDNKRIVSASYDKTIRLWDAEKREPIGAPLAGHMEDVRMAAFSPDNKRIVSASYDKTIRLWDAEKFEPIGAPLIGHTEEVFSVAFSPDGKRIVSGSEDMTVRVWDAEKLEPIGAPLVGHVEAVFSAAFSPDGHYVVSASRDNTLALWDADKMMIIGWPFRGHTSAVNSAEFSPDGRRILSASSDMTMRLWDVPYPPRGELLRVGKDSDFTKAAFSPDGRRIVSVAGPKPCGDATIRLWDAATGEPVGEPGQVNAGPILDAAFAPDGKSIVTASCDMTVRLWDATTLKPVGQPFRGHTDVVRSAAFSPDGLQVISASKDGTVRLWKTATGEPIWVNSEPSPPVNSASFSPDGRRIVSASFDNTLRIWDIETRKLVKSLGDMKDFQEGEPLRGLARYLPTAAFSPDGRRIVSTSDDNTIMLWDVEKMIPDGVPFRGHFSAVYGAAFSPDGRRVVSASADGTLRVWDVETGQQLGEPLYSPDVTSVAFSPKEWRIVSASNDGTILRWDVSAYALGLDEAVRKADQLCPLDNAELSSHGMFDRRFPEESPPQMTDAQRTACGGERR